MKNGNFLLFGLQLENEERYWDGSNAMSEMMLTYGATNALLTPPTLSAEKKSGLKTMTAERRTRGNLWKVVF